MFMNQNQILLPDTDLSLSPFCAGGAIWGTELRGDDLARVLDAFRDLGGNFFGTAHGCSFWLHGSNAWTARAC